MKGWGDYMKAVNIEWDADSYEELGKLPQEIGIPSEITDLDEVSDYLSDITGYCHKGFDIETVEDTPQDVCPICGTLFPTDDSLDFIPAEEIHFCYHCGARMDKEVEV